MHERHHPPQSTPRLPRIILSVTLLFLCAMAVACGDTNPVRPDADQELTTSLAQTKTRYISIIKEGIDPQTFAEEAKLILVSYSPSTRLAVLEGKKNVNQQLILNGTDTFGEAAPLSVSDPIDLLMGFQEGSWDFDDFETQDNLGTIDLPTVHEYALGSGVKVAILDSGADFSHPLLQGRLIDLQVPGLPPADEAWEEGDDPDNPVGAWGHGTHIAGIIAMAAPGAELWPIPVLSPDGPSTSVELALGLQAALNNGADIVNLSLRLEGADATIEDLLRQLSEAGIHVLAAAGNDGEDSPVYPAKSPHTVAVAAVGIDDALASFTSYGPYVELAAPGVGIVSAYPSPPPDHKYPQRSGSGTSMACAATSGALACIMGPHDRPRPSPPMERLLETATGVVPDASKIVEGRIRPTNALMILPIVGF